MGPILHAAHCCHGHAPTTRHASAPEPNCTMVKRACAALYKQALLTLDRVACALLKHCILTLPQCTPSHMRAPGAPRRRFVRTVWASWRPWAVTCLS